MTNTKPIDDFDNDLNKDDENIILFESEKEEEVLKTSKKIQEIDIKEHIQNRIYGASCGIDKNLVVHKHSLFKSIVLDIQEHILTYILAFVLCVLCVYKIHQVQETRNIVAKYNQVLTDNENLHKKWLELIATKQKLSEHTEIKKAAVERLGMMTTKTEAELVINLNR